MVTKGRMAWRGMASHDRRRYGVRGSEQEAEG